MSCVPSGASGACQQVAPGIVSPAEPVPREGPHRPRTGVLSQAQTEVCRRLEWDAKAGADVVGVKDQLECSARHEVLGPSHQYLGATEDHSALALLDARKKAGA